MTTSALILFSIPQKPLFFKDETVNNFEMGGEIRKAYKQKQNILKFFLELRLIILNLSCILINGTGAVRLL